MRKDLDLCPVFRIVRADERCLPEGALVEGFMGDGFLMVYCTDPRHAPWIPPENNIKPYNQTARDLIAITRG